MAKFWDRLVSAGVSDEEHTERPAEIAPAASAPAPQERYSANATLESIGMQNENLRTQIEEIERGFEQFDAVKGSFRSLLSPLSDLLADFEATKARMRETKIKLGALQESHEGLKARHSASVGELDAIAETRNALLRENREFQQRVQRLEGQLSEAQLDVRDTASAKEKLERLLSVETRQTASLVEEVKRVKDELEGKDQHLATLELSLKTDSDTNALLAQEHATLRASSQIIANSLDAANRRVSECEALIEQAKHRNTELERALAGEQAAHTSLRSKHLEHVERSRSETAGLGNTIQAVRGRADTAEKILAEARGQLREKIEELRSAERRLLEGGIKLDSLEKGARSLKEDLAAANERIAGTERVRGSLVDQVNSLTESARTKDAALQTATRKVEQLSARLEELTRDGQRAREEWERSAAALREEVERERAERNLAEGALHASRVERQQARRAPPPTNDARSESTSTLAPSETGEPTSGQQSNVTLLPRAASLL
jgi:chromosome segregation ATPase